MGPEDQEDAETALWRRLVDHLVARGARPAEAIEGATLVLGAYRRRGRCAASPGSGGGERPGAPRREAYSRREA